MKINGPIRALGAMSGTSLDGVDAAVLVTDGVVISGFGETDYRAYAEDERAVLYAALGCWPGDDLAAAEKVVAEAHAEVLRGFEDVALVGFHGQTLAHDPGGRGTHQLGDGAGLAGALGLPVVWDFRSSDVELGGQGAPLAPFYHWALARWIAATAPCAFLNLGGVGNVTWVDPQADAPEAPEALLAFDTGPANAPINDVMQSRRGQPFDAGGALAAKGQVDEGVITEFLANAYFYKIPPKSLDRDTFAGLVAACADLSDADAVATLTAAAALAVSEGLHHCPSPPETLWVTGGGRHNDVMMKMLAASLDCPVRPVEDAGLDGDMLEAQAFAYLAVRVARGLPTSCPGTTGVRAAVSGGTLSYPRS